MHRSSLMASVLLYFVLLQKSVAPILTGAKGGHNAAKGGGKKRSAWTPGKGQQKGARLSARLCSLFLEYLIYDHLQACRRVGERVCTCPFSPLHRISCQNVAAATGFQRDFGKGKGKQWSDPYQQAAEPAAKRQR